MRGVGYARVGYARVGYAMVYCITYMLISKFNSGYQSVHVQTGKVKEGSYK